MNSKKVQSLLNLLIALCVILPYLGYSSDDKAWQTLEELTSEELEFFDPAQNTERDAEIPYLPAEDYPFKPPYTAEEMGYRYAEFPHISRWNHVINDVFGAITPSGYLNQGAWISLNGVFAEDGLAGYSKHKAGTPYAKWIVWQSFPPDLQGGQQFWVPYRTNKEHRKKLDFYIYSKGLRRIRRMPEPRRDQRFPDNAQSLDDVMGRDPWEFNWTLIGTDTLKETVRWPQTRPTITLNPNGKGFKEFNTSDIKIMGDEFEQYLPNGGVSCWVLKGVGKSDWLPSGYGEKYIIVWLEKDTFYPLRTEKYGHDDRLIMIDVRLAKIENAARGKLGYGAFLSVYWNLDHDLISYSMHDGNQQRNWTKKEKEMIFSPEFMRREWLLEPIKTQALVPQSDQFFLRSHLFLEKFPEHRKITLPPGLQARYDAQEAAGKLVFESNPED